MKTQIFQNWFKLMLGISALIISVSFFIRTISPVYGNSLTASSNLVSTNGYAEGGYVFFINNGYIYRIKQGRLSALFIDDYEETIKFYDGCRTCVHYPAPSKDHQFRKIR